jgi:hypothetical protein
MDSLLEIKYWILYWKPNSLLVWGIRTREKSSILNTRFLSFSEVSQWILYWKPSIGFFIGNLIHY